MASLSLQQALVSSYLQEFSVKKVIGHDRLRYREIGIKYLFLIGLVMGCALFFDLFESINDVLMKRIYSIIVVIIYVGCLYELIDTYLDTLVVTDVGLVLFQRHNPFSQTTSIIQRVAIESLERTHEGFRASLFNLGNVRIQVEDQRFVFNRISQPAKTVMQILKAKEKAIKWQRGENLFVTPAAPPVHGDKETYNVFVEALGEVMEEYLKKKEKN